jgi:polyisoprenoid-binding protein YceI
MFRAVTFAAWVLAIVGAMLCAAQRGEQARAIDTQNSKLIVHVSKSGLFSGFGDNHEVGAPITEGFIDYSTRRVNFEVESRRMKVLDPQLSADKRQQVQERMLGPDVLDVARFPLITFESTSVEQAAPGRLLVRGQVFLHGVTRPVIIHVQTENGHYVGTASFKQREFGIIPISIAGGTVKVKDELKIEFDIRTSAQTIVAPK